MTDRVTIPPREELLKRFAELATARDLARHKAFYDELLTHCGASAGDREIVLWIALASKHRTAVPDEFNISTHIDAMAGRGTEVARSARAMMERIALRM